MILIADSGSTKCDWALFDRNKLVFKTQTQGLNPNLLTTQMMHKRIVKSAEVAHVNSDVKEVYFYGAGCGTSKNKIRIKRFLEKYFVNSRAYIYEDIVGACKAVTTQPSIVCILGTGSNSCYFDGENTTTPYPSLGYSVMDEASGNYFGKQLLRDYFYNRMPIDIAQKFKEDFDLHPYTIKNNLYRKDHPNVYLAEFSKFIFTYNQRPEYFTKMLKQGIQKFIEDWVKVFPQAQHPPIHFVGSLAYYSQQVIAEILMENNLKLGQIKRRPIDGLVEYFKSEVIGEY